ncbi:hypothetical protein M2451_002847 [Dysgonomonas sp. PFB1-18]|uniref:transglutaminase-like domain-containing protein n=1 Tax=unclassified Dysgonomonas TaxID=2630389 RepID=UPI0024768FB1|nr:MULTISPECIES: transglutaminase-like domain-containing protein [unclassified Dysgonomonas]MDH6309956.1 hypothetical protein [Dysgonomonas sp. PF1-14]MDH6339866.1 hypothetical protein [Dysgonomonas sp. PF1-16]MDH6381514.1 hypothetical protein [Dysgonomonas sp. PFB1-18]MDH6398850.1 hypothetical protein [Dysgonomonas sp. PF1-23]
MKTTSTIISALLLICITSCTPKASKDEIRIVKATSDTVDIRDGKFFREKAWTIMPDIKPDVYTSVGGGKKVTFYTDIDSISFDVEENQTYDFVILRNGTDSAWTQIKVEMSYLTKLKNAKEYNYSDQRPIPEWTYMSSDNPDLKKLRAEYKLDSVAGNGDEISKIMNLMYWLHDLVPHDGSSSNPSPRNAMNIIKVCKEQNRGVNCRMLATALNECYLAMGIKSRFVTCMPKELEFDDCHVINAVYSNDLGKWIWIDPSFAAYVKDENGVLLGIQEVRERLIDGRPLVLNEDANWNHKEKQTKEYYLETYMAKNLYRLECSPESKYNMETRTGNEDAVYVQLLPLDALNQSPQKDVKEQKKRMWIDYKTNNPDLFWVKPK